MKDAARGGPEAGRFEELDVLRGLAAFSVVLFHYTVRYDQMFHVERDHVFQLVYGYYGVKLFFMISGFVITMTLARTRTLTDFVVSRVSRLYPVYWAAVTLTFVVMLSVTANPPAFSDYLVNLTMLQRFLRVGDIDGVYWSLAHELGFYVLMAGLFATGLLKRLYVVAWVWLAGVVLFQLYPRLVPDPLHILLALAYGNLFIAGMMFFEVWRHGPDRRALALLVAAFAVSLWKEATPLGAFLLASFFGVFALMITGRLRWIRFRAFVFLGAISYSLYLTHQNIGYRFIFALDRLGWPSFAVDVAAILLALAIASLLTFLIERPAQRWIRERYRARRERRTLALGLGASEQ